MSTYVERSNSNLIKRFIRNWYWFLLCLAATIAYTWYLLEQKPLIYNVSGSIIVEEDKSNSGQLPEEAIIQGLPFKNKGNLDRQIQILKSRNLMEKVVEPLKIDIVYFVEHRFLAKEIYKTSPIKLANVDNKEKAYGKMLRVKQLDNNRFALLKGEDATLFYNFGEPFVYEGSTFTLERDTAYAPMNDVIRIQLIPKRFVATFYASQLTFQKQAQSNILTVSINGDSPAKLIDIIHELVNIYNVITQEEKNKRAAQSLNFINERLVNLNSELFSVEGQQAALKSRSNVTTDVDASAERFIQKLNAAEESRAQINNTRNTLYNLENFLADRDNQYELIPNVGELAGISFAPLITQYNQIISNRQRLLVSVTPKHPDVIKGSEELAKMRKTIFTGINLAIQDLDKKDMELVSQAAPVERKVQSMPFVQKQLNEITRKVDVKNGLVLYMLQKREETAIGLSTQVESIRILDEPVQGGAPVAPNEKQYYMLAFLFGLVIPGSVLYMLDRMDDKVQNKAELKGLTTVPFIGDVAYDKNERGKLVTSSSRSRVAEMFRLIRTNLQFLTANIDDKTILVTSYASGDGKTFIAGNLGACLSFANKKTIVLELDLRKPQLSEFILKKPPTVGITNYLVREKEIEDIIQPIEGFPDLFLISSGPTPPNPAELILSERMEQLINYLKENYDYIILDTPPVEIVTDAYLLNKFCTASIFVTRAGKTKKEELKSIEEICNEGKLNHPAFVLNGVKLPKRYGYYN